jgi:hypothetical protein
MDGKTEGKRKEANKEKVSGKNSGGRGISSAAPIVGAVFGLLVRGIFSNALRLRGKALLLTILMKPDARRPLWRRFSPEGGSFPRDGHTPS